MRAIVRAALAAAAATGFIILAPDLAAAKVHITVDLDTQTMHVDAGDRTFDWPVSSGKPGFETPAGTYGVLWMDKDHHSDEYEQAPMPNAIFFAPGFAIHGFSKSPWGHAASHGCVRLPVAKSAILFDLVKAQGADVSIVGDSPRTLEASRGSRREDAGDAPVAYGYDDGQRPAAPRYDAQTYGQSYGGQSYGNQGYAAQNGGPVWDGVGRSLFGGYY